MAVEACPGLVRSSIIDFDVSPNRTDDSVPAER